jgi:NAD(P)-dependent dehydrogenase (short-subunit alcohol dehydrogenase family)
MSRLIPEGFKPEKNCLKDRVIVVTGGANGIGAAASRTYAAQGATVVLMDKNVECLETLYDEIEDAGHPQPAIYPLDFEGAKEDDYNELAIVLDREFGRIDGLLHNAARRDPHTPLWKIDLEDWYEILQVNLNAPYMLTRACMDLLNKAPSASVIFTTDHQSRKHHAYWGAYGVSKHALDGLMLTFADELENQSPIRVNAIDPGAVRTNMRVTSFPGIRPEEMTDPQDIMDTYMYLMCDASKNENGYTFWAQESSTDPTTAV